MTFPFAGCWTGVTGCVSYESSARWTAVAVALLALLAARPAAAVDLDIRGDTYAETGAHSFDDILTDKDTLIALDTVFDPGNPTAGDLSLAGTFITTQVVMVTPVTIPNSLDGEMRVGADNILDLNTPGNPSLLLPRLLTLDSGIIRSNSDLMVANRPDGFNQVTPHFSGAGLIIGNYAELDTLIGSFSAATFTRDIDLGTSNTTLIAGAAVFEGTLTMNGGTLGYSSGGDDKSVLFQGPGTLAGHGTVDANGRFRVDVTGGDLTLGRTDNNQPLEILGGFVAAGNELVLRTFADPTIISPFFSISRGVRSELTTVFGLEGWYPLFSTYAARSSVRFKRRPVALRTSLPPEHSRRDRCWWKTLWI